MFEKKKKSVAGTTGLEPATSDVTGRRSNQLNYDPVRTTIFQISRMQISDWGVSPTVIPICGSVLKSDLSNLKSHDAEWAVQDSNL